MRYLLDAHAVIAALNEPRGAVSLRLRSLPPSDVAVSAVVLPLDTEDARHAGEVRAGLAAQGTPIGAYDVLVAGQARARGLVLVTRHVREFERVPGLAVENWQHAAPD